MRIMIGRIICVALTSLFLACTVAEAKSVSKVFHDVKNSVVTIHTIQKTMTPSGRFVRSKGLGSGVLISANGHVLTAAHVIQIADKVTVEFPGGATLPAEVISSEPLADVALLKLKDIPEAAVVAELGNSDAMEVGSKVFIVGAPYGLSHTLTVGHLSARHAPYSLPGALLGELFQTDAAINQGNSGGPMFNMDGEVIGIVSHILTKSGGFEGLGFAATSKTARELMLERKPFWGGAHMIMLSGDLARALNVPQKRATLVQQVADGSPADRIGLMGGTIPVTIGNKSLLLGGDIILEAMGISFAEDGSYLKMRAAVDKLPDNGKLTVKVLRGGTVIELWKKLKR